MNFIIDQLQKNKAVFQDLLNDHNEEMVLWKQAPEKWCLLEIVCHLYDEELYDFRFRTQWVLEKPNQTPPPIDPIGWVTKHSYIKQDYATMLKKFLFEREQSMIWLQSLKNVNWDHSFEHSKLGTLTAKHFLTNWLAHDYLHVKQILKLKYDYLKHQSGEHLGYAGIWSCSFYGFIKNGIMKKVNSVEEYIEIHSHFGEGLSILRQIINSTELEETLKWSAPVYTLNGKNVLGLGAFKTHFGIWFFNGVFLKDEKQLLSAAQETTKGLRQMRFQSISEIDKHAVLAYVKEAIENQKLGKETKPEKKGKTVIIPEELNDALKKDTGLNDAFKSLTPFKQREYAEYIDTAKRTETKQTRLEKIVPMILKGIGLNDKYKNC